jgi:hypothetical protein
VATFLEILRRRRDWQRENLLAQAGARRQGRIAFFEEQEAAGKEDNTESHHRGE